MDGPGEKQGGMGHGALGSGTEILGLNPNFLWQVASLHWPILRSLTSLTHSGPWAHLWHSTQQTALACVPQVTFGNVWRLL